MAFDFPASPTEDQSFTPPGGPTYVFKSGRWLTAGAVAGVPEAPNDANAYVRSALAWVIGYTKAAADTLLALKAPLASPTFTGDPKSVTPATADNDTSIATTAHVQANMALKANASHTHPQSEVTNLVTDLALKAPLASPALTGTPTVPTAAPLTATTQAASTAFVGAAVSAIPAGTAATAQTANRIVNPAMQHSQENSNTAGTTNSYYMADQWFMPLVTSGVMSAQRVVLVTPNGSMQRAQITVTTADASLTTNETVRFSQRVEGNRIADFDYGLATARQSVLRFGFRAPAGTYAFSIKNDITTRAYIKNFTISAGQANTDTTQVFVIPGDTTGTWATSTGTFGAQLDITLAAGPDRIGVEGWQATTGQITAASGLTNNVTPSARVFQLFDVGWHLDPDMTGLPPRWQLPDFPTEFMLCSRYWQEVSDYDGGYHHSPASGTLRSAVTYLLPVLMCSTPIIVQLSARTYDNCTFTDHGTTAQSYSCRVAVSGGGAYRAILGRFAFNARL